MLVTAATSWTAMNNIVGKKPTVPPVYHHMQTFTLSANFLVQCSIAIVAMLVTTRGDERIKSGNWYDGNLSAFRSACNLLVEQLCMSPPLFPPHNQSPSP
jgi:hypothetical protein